jgi:kynurenine formamidase
MNRLWRGWNSRATAANPQPWVDLSHPLRSDLSRVAFFPAARFERIMSMPKDPLNATEMQMVCHFGTHVDAPCHFIANGPAFHEIPIDRLCGAGVVARLECEPYATIEPAQVAAAADLRPDDILLLDTGWAAHFGTPLYEQQPCLSVATAEWLVEQRVKLLAIDFATPDLAVNRRPPGFDWPVHHVLLSQGVLIAEHLTNLRALSPGRVEVLFLALNIEGSDGGPCRVVARAL